MRRILACCVAAVSVLVVMPPGAALASPATTLVVDDDGAQCGNAAYKTIGEAVAVATPGDTVRVCPGVYRERVDIGKTLRLIGQRDQVAGLACVDQAWSSADTVDPALLTVLEPPDEVVGSLLRLQADGIEVAGLVVQGQADPGLTGNIFAPAIQADGANSGHWIHHNLVQNNTFGIELGGNGAALSRVDHNCLRGNSWAVANQRYTTSNVRVDHNDAFRTRVIPFEVGSLAGGVTDPRFIRDARFDHNRSVGSGFAAFLVDRAESVQLDHNTVEAPGQNGNGVYIRGGNNNVAVTDNQLTGTATAAAGIALAAPVVDAPQPSTRVVVANNTVERFNVGIGLSANARTTDTRLLDNVTTTNRLAGIEIRVTNTNALVQGNQSDGNLYGIRTATAAVTGNHVVGNSMHANTGFDAVESSFTTTGGVTTLNNTWDGNTCDTDSPPGVICGS